MSRAYTRVNLADVQDAAPAAVLEIDGRRASLVWISRPSKRE
jgi:hypothetical protein